MSGRASRILISAAESWPVRRNVLSGAGGVYVVDLLGGAVEVVAVDVPSSRAHHQFLATGKDDGGRGRGWDVDVEVPLVAAATPFDRDGAARAVEGAARPVDRCV